MASALNDIDSVTDQLAKASVEGRVELSFSGKGLKLDSEKDAKEIVEAIQGCPNLNVLELKGNTLGVAASKAIGDALAKQPEFKRALWSDLFTGRLKTEIPDALKNLCSGMMSANARLVELDLSDNAFGPNGMIGLMDFLKSSSCFSLQELRLNNNGLGIQGGKMLAESLSACYKSSVENGKPLALRVFVSGRGRLEDEGATALAGAFKAMKSLVEVHMPQNGINHRGITALADAFAENTSLRILNLSDNTFTEKGSISMAKAVASLEDLEEINFEDCLMRTEGAKALAKAIATSHRKLKIVKLSGNEISKDGAKAVASSMANKDKLSLIDLNANQLGEDGIDSIKETLESIGKLEMLGSLSDDEGSEDEDDEEDEDGEGSDKDVVEPEEDEEGEEVVGRGLEINGLAITPRPETKASVAEEFLQFPSPMKLQQLLKAGPRCLVDHLGDVAENPEKAVEAFMKVSLVVTENDADNTKSTAFAFTDSILSRLFDSSNETTSLASNLLLVSLGLLKGEDKKYRPASNIQGPLIVLEHSIRQSYFPSLAKDILKAFISQPHRVFDNCSDARQKLLQTLTTSS